MSDDAKKPQVVHIKKFDGGRSTPDEMHRKYALGGGKKRCATCGNPKVAIRIRVLVELAELTKRNPDFVAGIMATNPDGSMTVPSVRTKYGQMVRVNDAVFCDNCKVGAEKAAAKGPSWAIVEIDRQGLGKSFKPVVQVPRGPIIESKIH